MKSFNIKNVFILILISTIMFLCACTKTESSNTYAETVSNEIATEIEQIEGYEDLEDETIKALSVVIRSKYKFIENQNLLNDNKVLKTNINNSTATKNKNHQRILNLINQTNNETILTSTKPMYYDSKNNENLNWSKTISKANILKFLQSNNISLSSISKINSITDKDGKTTTLVVGEKQIDFEIIKNAFGLKSNIITNIKENVSSVTISGKIDPSPDSFDICEANILAKQGISHGELIKKFIKINNNLSEK